MPLLCSDAEHFFQNYENSNAADNITDTLFSKIVGIEEGSFSRELYMSVDLIKCMVDCGMHSGSHGYDHYWLGLLSN